MVSPADAKGKLPVMIVLHGTGGNKEGVKRLARRLRQAPFGTASGAGCSVLVSPESAGWTYSGLTVLDLAPGESRTWSTGPRNTRAAAGRRLPRDLRGGDVRRARARGRLRRPQRLRLRPSGRRGHLDQRRRRSVRAAVGGLRARLPFRHLPSRRRAGRAARRGRGYRQVNNFCTPAALEADRLIACEVLTPAGNWSSYPPHKHDEATRDRERARGDLLLRGRRRPGGPGIGYQRVYGHRRADRRLRRGPHRRCRPVPYGWHGPSMAAPATTCTTSTSWPAPARARLAHQR